jgi:hypothetical protein
MRAFAAGLEPAAHVHPEAVEEIMREIAIDLSSGR